MAIGTGASAIQFVPAVQPQVDKLSLLQRTPAWGYLNAVRDSLSLPGVHDALRALGVAYQKSGQVHDLSYGLDGRSVSCYVLEVTFNVMANAVDLPVTTINSAPVDTSEITS